jgi:hypothetical protein
VIRNEWFFEGAKDLDAGGSVGWMDKGTRVRRAAEPRAALTPPGWRNKEQGRRSLAASVAPWRQWDFR